jgi:hypothetical protein
MHRHHRGTAMTGTHPTTTACDWCGQKDTDPIKPQDGEITR